MKLPNTAAGLIAALLWPLMAQAATVQVTVLGRDGKPLADAVVVVEPAAGAKPAAPAPVSAVINQQKMQFLPGTAVLPVGSKVTFTNLDTWEHHVRGTPAGLASLNPGTQPGFELRLGGRVEGKEPTSADVVLDKAGAVQLSCHLHGSMRGFIFVADSPWTVLTDANGVATLQNVPEGAAKVRIVHADQLLEATPVAVTITQVTALNLPTQVQPRRRRP